MEIGSVSFYKRVSFQTLLVKVLLIGDIVNGLKGDVAPIISLTGGEERVKVIRCRLQGKHREKQGSSGFLLPPLFKFNENRFNVNIF